MTCLARTPVSTIFENKINIDFDKLKTAAGEDSQVIKEHYK